MQTDTDVVIQGPLTGQGPICAEVLADLPDWFGIEEANRDYETQTHQLPTFVAHADGQPIGFMALKFHSAESAELYVLGVKKAWHRHGVGKQLLGASESYLKGEGIQFVQVKTLAATADDSSYEKTRAFYLANGYVTLEVMPDLWDPSNPCLIMIKSLQA